MKVFFQIIILIASMLIALHVFGNDNYDSSFSQMYRKRLGITVFQPRLKVCTFARTNYYEYGKQRQVQESP